MKKYKIYNRCLIVKNRKQLGIIIHWGRKVIYGLYYREYCIELLLPFFAVRIGFGLDK